MFWTLSFHLMEDETVIDDSTRRPLSRIKPAYSVILTNKRAVFRFNGVGSSMAQSFEYSEIVDAAPVKRLLISYLLIRTATKQYFLHTPAPEFWARQIVECKRALASRKEAKPAGDQTIKNKQELLYMLFTLRRSNIISETELEQKKKLIEGLAP